MLQIYSGKQLNKILNNIYLNCMECCLATNPTPRKNGEIDISKSNIKITVINSNPNEKCCLFLLFITVGIHIVQKYIFKLALDQQKL